MNFFGRSVVWSSGGGGWRGVRIWRAHRTVAKKKLGDGCREERVIACRKSGAGSWVVCDGKSCSMLCAARIVVARGFLQRRIVKI